MVSVCYILSYYSPDYVRTRTLIKALQQIDSVKLYQCRNTSKGPWRYFQTLAKLIGTRIVRTPDFYILGFRGYEYYWLVRLITVGKPLIFDHMMSPYDSLVNERKQIRKNGLLERLIYFYEKLILNSSEVVLTDTDNHKDYFQELFSITSKKIVAIPVGADEDLFYPAAMGANQNTSSPFEVLFYGSFLPLHGIDEILRAASILRDKAIHFTLIGGNRLDLSGFHRMIEQLDLHNVTHIDWVEHEELPHYISRADLGLGGPFGNTGQAGRVITGKTFQFLAMAKPVVLGKVEGNNDGFEDKINSLVVIKGDEKSLADAISWAFSHKGKLGEIGQRGYELYKRQYSIKQISETIKGIVSL